jgi:hypothetical protein
VGKFQFLILVTLLILNLLVSLSLRQSSVSSEGQVDEVVLSQSDNLPAVLTDAVRERLLNEFSAAFNKDDYDAIYDMFSPAAKARIDKNDIIKELQKLKKAFYSVSGGGFSHFEYVRSMGGADVYTLFYNVRLSELSDFGPAGELKITIAVQGSRFQVYGIRLSSQ